MTGNVLFRAVGDVILDREDPAGAFESVGSLLREADVTFGNCETVYSETGELNPIVRNGTKADPSNARALRPVGGFDVMAFTNNHHMDHGYGAFDRTRAVLAEEGIAVVGAGANIADARQPVIVTRNGVRIAFVGYCCILFPGFEADIDRAGGVPLKVHTHYFMVEEEQPGTPAGILTIPDERHLADMVDDIEAAAEKADVVVASYHWGLHFTRAEVADYERIVARAAIDAGAGLVLGHHAHILKGIDFYRDVPIFHNLGNFIMDIPVPSFDNTLGQRPRTRALLERYRGRFGPEAGYPLYPFAPDARMTMIVDATISPEGVSDVGLYPCLIDPSNVPRVLSRSDPGFWEVHDYLSAITEEAGLNATFEPDGDRIRIHP